MRTGLCESPTVCLCAGVSEDEVLAAKAAGSTDLAALRDATGANTGCGDCRDDLEDLLEW